MARGVKMETMKKIVLTLSVLLLVFGVFAGAVSAENQTGNQTRGPSPEKFAEIKSKVLDRLNDAIDRLTKLRDKLQQNGVDVSKLNSAIDGLKSARDAASAATNFDQLRSAITAAKTAHGAARDEAKAEVEEKAKKKCSESVNKANGLFARLDTIVAKLKAAGVDTTKLEADIAAAKAKLTDASGKCNTAPRDAAHLLKDANAKLRDVREDMRQASQERREEKRDDRQGPGNKTGNRSGG